MSVSWEQEADDLLVARISGELTLEAMAEFQQAVEPIVQAAGRIAFLVILEDFAGWAESSNWADTSFPDENDQFLSRFAIVGDEQWRDKVLMFSLAGLRPVEIEFFNDEAAAREWVTAG